MCIIKIKINNFFYSIKIIIKIKIGKSKTGILRNWFVYMLVVAIVSTLWIGGLHKAISQYSQAYLSLSLYFRHSDFCRALPVLSSLSSKSFGVALLYPYLLHYFWVIILAKSYWKIFLSNFLFYLNCFYIELKGNWTYC